MPIESIKWTNGRLIIIDQTKLPLDICHLEIDNHLVLCEAIKKLRVRGAPAIGVAAAFGVVIGVNQRQFSDLAEFRAYADSVIAELAATRPTAVNLFWALERMKAIIHDPQYLSIDDIRTRLLDEAKDILAEDRTICRAMGRHGATLLNDGDTVLTHCNAGALATVDYGTALGVIYAAHEAGKRIRVFADETRPLLQGARLTTWELMQSGIDVTLICDNTAAVMMKQGKIDCVLVGADRIAANGDTANKIGTYNLAVIARYHDVKFYVVAPTSTLDFSIEEGKDIPIEERSPEEVTEGFGRRTAPYGVKVVSPAFDVTPNSLITAIITENGIIPPPFVDTLRFENSRSLNQRVH